METYSNSETLYLCNMILIKVCSPPFQKKHTATLWECKNVSRGDRFESVGALVKCLLSCARGGVDPVAHLRVDLVHTIGHHPVGWNVSEWLGPPSLPNYFNFNRRAPTCGLDFAMPAMHVQCAHSTWPCQLRITNGLSRGSLKGWECKTFVRPMVFWS